MIITLINMLYQLCQNLLLSETALYQWNYNTQCVMGHVFINYTFIITLVKIGFSCISVIYFQ